MSLKWATTEVTATKVVLTYAVTAWSLTMSPIVPKKAQTTQRLIIDSIENWKDIGPSFWLIWITWWVFLIPVIFRGQVGVKVQPKSQNLDQYCHYKNLSYSKCFKRHLYSYEEYYLWQKCLLNQTLLTRFIAPKNQKMGQNGSWTKKT